MVNKIYNINLDLRRVTAQAESIPPVVDGDNGNVFIITLTNDGTPVDLSGCKVLCVFSKTDGSTVEQDTEDANVTLSDYGIAVTGTATANDTVTITVSGGSCSAAVSGSISAATVDAATFLTMFPDDGTYVFTYSGTSWVYGSHSVVISGTNHNIVNVALKTASFGVGKNNCELQIYSGNVLVTTAQFNFDGRKGIINSETIQSEEKYPVLLGLIAEATNALNLALPFQNPSVLADTLPAGSDATVTLTVGQNYVEWKFGIPQGRDGAHAPSDTPALSLGVAAAGVSDKYSREDHVHPMPDADDIPTDTVGVSVQDELDSHDSSITSHGTAITNLQKKTVLHFTSVACSAMTGDFATISDNAITANHVVLEMTFADPNYITSDVTWTTSSGSLVLNGTCSTATTVDVVLGYKDN